MFDGVRFFIKLKDSVILSFYFQVCGPDHTAEVRPRRCSASTEYSNAFRCEKAFDGVLTDGWASVNEVAGAWIQPNFDGLYSITKIAVMQRPQQNESIKDVSLEFSDGSLVNFILPDTPNQWIEIDLRTYGNVITSSYVNITVKSVYVGRYSGFTEIKIFGCVDGKISCP